MGKSSKKPKNNGLKGISHKTSDKNKKDKLSHQFELIVTCFHESGHTITGLLNFIKISVVGVEVTEKIIPDKDLGYTDFIIVCDSETTADKNLINYLLEAEILTNYGGFAAEKNFYKDICGTDKIPMIIRHGSYLDRDRVAEIIKKYNLAPPGKKRHSFKQKLFHKTQLLLEDFWADVKLIARTLFNRRRLNYEDLKKILIKKSENKVFWKQRFKDIELLFNSSDLSEDYIYNIIANH